MSLRSAQDGGRDGYLKLALANAYSVLSTLAEVRRAKFVAKYFQQLGVRRPKRAA